MPVINVKKDGQWQDIASTYKHTHTSSDITDLPADTADVLASLQEKVGADSVAYQINTAVQASQYVHPDTHPASMIEGLATVATSGNYNDLSNKPTIPSIAGLATKTYVDEQIASVGGSGGMTEQVQSDWDETDTTSPAYIKNKPVTSGDGGTSVQANWNQNDSTQADYIKNRPFYDGGTVLKEFVDGDFTFEYEGGGEGVYLYTYMNAVSKDVVDAWNVDFDTATVIWGGSTYSSKPFVMRGSKGIGNIDLMYETGDNGEPFIIGYGDMDGTGNYMILMYAIESTAPEDTENPSPITKTVKVSAEVRDIHKLPLKFHWSPDWNERDPESGSYIKNKPFGITPAGTVILEETTVNCQMDYGNNIYIAFINELDIGTFAYDVKFDGVNCQIIGEEYSGMIGIEYDTDSLSFFIIKNFEGTGYNVIMSTQGEHTVKITLAEDVIQTIDPKFIPKIDGLPEITDSDNGKTLKVVEGAWTIADSLPTVTSSDAGKFLRVSSTGTWVVEAVGNAEEVAF